ncbi:MAG: thioredoxin domain-containing protein [Steroidobacteraceae bacterium]|nr:thioredoxin domain-containing protein [Steroidobacteraceae bacterium]
MRIAVTSLVAVVFLSACSKTADAPPPPAESPAKVAATPVSAEPAAQAPPMSRELAARLIREHSPVIGPANARVTIVEVLDPACEGCAAFAPIVHGILFVHPEDVKVVVRFAAFHQGSEEVVRLLEAARQQGKFEPMLDALFGRQAEWASHSAPNLAHIWKIAADVGLNVPRARKDAAAPRVDDILRQEKEDTIALRVAQTPTFFVNERPMLEFGSTQLKALVESELERTKPAAP